MGEGYKNSWQMDATFVTEKDVQVPVTLGLRIVEEGIYDFTIARKNGAGEKEHVLYHSPDGNISASDLGRIEKRFENMTNFYKVIEVIAESRKRPVSGVGKTTLQYINNRSKELVLPKPVKPVLVPKRKKGYLGSIFFGTMLGAALTLGVQYFDELQPVEDFFIDIGNKIGIVDTRTGLEGQDMEHLDENIVIEE